MSRSRAASVLTNLGSRLLASSVPAAGAEASARSIASAGPGPSSLALQAGWPQHRPRYSPALGSGFSAWGLRQLASQAEPSARNGWGSKPPVSMQGLLLALMAGAAGISAIKAYKDEKLQQVMVQSQQVVGKASVGGPFNLIDTSGKRFTDKDLLGEFALLYFGFTHCPDICPDELEKVAQAVDDVEKRLGARIVPVFISVDPERDTPARIASYVKEFHPRMLGLTGDLDEVKTVSKAYRVYYSKTGGSSATDYLVDHSIIHYLINPEGEFVTFYGKNYSAEQLADSMCEHVSAWKAAHPEYTANKPAPATQAQAGKAK